MSKHEEAHVNLDDDTNIETPKADVNGQPLCSSNNNHINVLKRKAQEFMFFNESSPNVNVLYNDPQSSQKGCNNPNDTCDNDTKHDEFEEPWTQPCSKKSTCTDELHTFHEDAFINNHHTHIEEEECVSGHRQNYQYTSEGDEEDEEGYSSRKVLQHERYYKDDYEEESEYEGSDEDGN